MNDNINPNLTSDHMTALFSETTKEFEAKNSVSEAKQRELAFGSILMHRFGESSRVFNLSRDLPLNDLMSLLHRYRIEDSEEARKMIKELSHADSFTTLATEVFSYFVEPGNLMPLSLDELPASIEGL